MTQRARLRRRVEIRMERILADLYDINATMRRVPSYFAVEDAERCRSAILTAVGYLRHRMEDESALDDFRL